MSYSSVINVFWKHEHYNESNFLNDIAILKLSKPVDLNIYVQLACLPSKKLNAYPPPDVSGYTFYQ